MIKSDTGLFGSGQLNQKANKNVQDLTAEKNTKKNNLTFFSPNNEVSNSNTETSLLAATLVSETTATLIQKISAIPSFFPRWL